MLDSVSKHGGHCNLSDGLSGRISYPHDRAHAPHLGAERHRTDFHHALVTSPRTMGHHSYVAVCRMRPTLASTMGFGARRGSGLALRLSGKFA